MRVVERVAEGGPRVALTFDDCNREETWLEILAILETQHAHATFFPSGMRVEQFPHSAQRTVSQGHAIGSHGWDHSRLTRLASEAVEAQLVGDLEAWRGLGVRSLSLFRPPYGDYDKRIMKVAEALGFSDLVLWDVDPRDWATRDARLVRERVLSAVRPGSVVELHVTRSTAQALPTIIAGMRGKKLEPVSLTALLAQSERHA
jgi:peptidoglycan/xylan/chitin deacetylase (PgdA/CDA1 family)